MSREHLGHTEQVMLKRHPDLKAHAERVAAADYCTVAEYIRRLIIADMRNYNKDET